jgi:orotidine-5'-phosphate decarboxylase
VIAFKPQIAYFAAHRAEDQLERLMAHIRRVAPEVPVILDAKRGDIGATAEQYAREAFERYQADAVTLSPFMGFDSIEPYLRWPARACSCCAARQQPGRQRPAGAALADGACCTSASPGWPPASGTAAASSAWWWAPPTRTSWRACASSRRRCRC